MNGNNRNSKKGLKQRTLMSMFTPQSSRTKQPIQNQNQNTNSVNNNNSPNKPLSKPKSKLTPEQKAMIEQKKQAALARLRAHGFKPSPRRIQSPNGGNVNNNNNNNNQPNNNNNNVSSIRSNRAKNFIMEDSESDNSPQKMVPQSNNRGKRKRNRRAFDDDSDDDYAPTTNDINDFQNEQNENKNISNSLQNTTHHFGDGFESDDNNDFDGPKSKKRRRVSTNSSSKSKSKSQPKNRFFSNNNNSNNNNNNDVSDEEEDIDITSNNKDNDAVLKLNSWALVEEEDDNNNNNGNNNNKLFSGRTYNEYKRDQNRYEKQRRTDVKGAGASHRAVCHQNWYKNPCDLSGKRRGDPGYNPTQISVPKSALKEMTPAQAKYWELKKTNFDGILFYKVGKFYELYNRDAEIAHELLGLNYMKGADPHAGFPEQSFEKYAEAFVKYGYKVYRTEQMETVEQMKKRKAKLVKRDVCQVLTKGTLTETEIIGEDHSNYLLSVVEEYSNAGGKHNVDYAVCFGDFSTNEFKIGHFSDDRNRTRLRTLIVQLRPSEVIYKKMHTSCESKSVFKTSLRDALQTGLLDEQFYSAHKTKQILSNDNNEYWSNEERKINDENNNNNNNDNNLDSMVDKNGKRWLPRIFKKDGQIWNNDYCMNAVGGMLYCLESTLNDKEILPNSIWNIYDPVNRKENGYLLLDGETLTNLEILENEDGRIDGTLFQFMDRTVTSFGKREFKRWLKTPLCNINNIESRLSAIDYLMNENTCSWRNDVRDLLGKLPDLERLLSRISALGTKNRKMDLAVMCCDYWQKNKIKIFMDILNGFTLFNDEILYLIHSNDNKNNNNNNNSNIPKLISDITTIGQCLPEFKPILNKFRECFDEKIAQEESIIVPTPGFDEEYDEVTKNIELTKEKLENILKQIKKDEFNGISRSNLLKIKYFHPARKPIKRMESYLIEIPVSVFNDVFENDDDIPDNWIPKGKTRAVRRFHTTEIDELLYELRKDEETQEIRLMDAARSLFARFSLQSHIWRQIVDNIAILDCLLSLSIVSDPNCALFDMCRPQFIENNNDNAFLELRHCRHPCIASKIENNNEFISNDTVMGCKENLSNFVIVTGPNMGGKSTLLRQTCIAVIMAHMGCYVPASYCKLSIVDRIFTRVGANDRILAGQSTFMVELEETANILRHATNNSLVILDELGRGTSTFDGTAIAYAVAKNLMENVFCRCLFSTHYHGLTDSFENPNDKYIKNNLVSMYHMSFMQKNNDITFLYKFTKGVCKESHGINCARLAGLPKHLLDNATIMSKELHDSMHQNDKNNKENKIKYQNTEKEFLDLLQGLITTKSDKLIDAVNALNLSDENANQNNNNNDKQINAVEMKIEDENNQTIEQNPAPSDEIEMKM